MNDNKLFSLFNSLSGVEKRECGKLLKSPFFNQKDEIIRLWEWMIMIKKQKKRFFPPVQEAFAYAYPGTTFDMAKWRHLQSSLSLLIEKLLVQRALHNEPLWSDLHLAPIYKQKKLPKLLFATFKRAEKQLAQMPKDHHYYHYQYQIQWEKYAAIESTERVGKKNLTNIGESLDIYIISSKLRLACLMESHHAVSNATYDATFLPLLIQYLEGNKMLEVPAIALYYHCYKSLTAGAESDFRAFRKTLEEQQQDIPLSERTTFLLLAINFCIKQLNYGKLRYIQEAFELYQTGLDTKALLSDGYLSRFAYKNIVALALKLNKFEWVRKFIDDYAIFLRKEYQDSNQKYNLARLYFIKKEFNKAMPMLAQIDDNDLLLNLDSRVMLLKMYYEMGEFDALESLLTSFRILLLRKKKIIGYHQQHYLNMLSYIKKMMKLNHHDKEAVRLFKENITQNTVIFEREWILEQMS